MCSCLQGADWDGLLAYPTVKMVLVRDWRLGFLKYLFMLGIVIYIIAYALFYKGGYLDIERPVGLVATSLLRPQVNVTAGQFPYCNCSANDGNKVGNKLPCMVWPEDMVLFPTVDTNSLFITTRISEKTLILNPACTDNFDDGNVTCGPNPSTVVRSTERYYLAGVDEYTIKITHAMQDTKHFRQTGHTKYSLEGTAMDGRLEDRQGKMLKDFPPNSPSILSLREILNAANTDLATLSDNPGAGTKAGETMRHAGIILMFIIYYDNTYSTNNRYPRFTFRVNRIHKAEYKASESLFVNSSARIIRDRHGVKIAFVQTGRIGKFDFQTTLVALVSSLALLSVATLIVDALMLYYCKDKQMYAHEKYQETGDFHSLDDPLVSQGGGGSDRDAVGGKPSWRM